MEAEPLIRSLLGAFPGQMVSVQFAVTLFSCVIAVWFCVCLQSVLWDLTGDRTIPILNPPTQLNKPARHVTLVLSPANSALH